MSNRNNQHKYIIRFKYFEHTRYEIIINRKHEHIIMIIIIYNSEYHIICNVI